MKKSMLGGMMAAIFALLFFPMACAASSIDPTLQIIAPAEMQTFDTSNVWITVRFNFSMQAEKKPFQAWLNGKPVGSLFTYTESLDATVLLSAADGMNASMNGPRMNVFRAEVEGLDGKKHGQTVQFLVDCSANHTPVANAGQGDRVFVNELVVLDGSGSTDVDGDPLAFQWSFVTVPKKSKAVFSDSSSANPSFMPDLPGDYVVELIVDDYKVKSEPKTVTFSVVQLKILVDHPVLDAIFERLSHHGIVKQFDGLQLPADYHLAVLDGGAITPEGLRQNPLIREALAKGLWVLVLNVNESQHQDGLASHLGIGSNGQSRAYLFRRFLDVNTPVFRILNLPRMSLAPDVVEAEILPEMILNYVGTLLKTLKESWQGSLRSVQAPPPDSPIPDGLINCRWDYSYAIKWTINYSGRQSASQGRIQFGSYLVNYTFTLFLDNGNNPTGNKQFLLLQIDGEGNPNDYGSSFLATQSDMDKHNEYAWFQDKFTVDVNPNQSIWHWVANDPTSPNAVTTYTANASFMVGFNQAQGGLGSFTFSCAKSYSLTDWGVKCNSSGNYMYWESLSTNPPEHDGGYDSYDDMYDWFYGMGKPKRPNTMSMNQTQYHTSVVWSTDTVVNQVATFNSHIREHIGDNWCSKDLGTTCCSSWNTHSSVLNFTHDLVWSIDLGVVIPIDISAITVSPDPVLVGPQGGTIQGTVVLKQPAKVDTLITGITSNSPHATPRTDRVVVPRGATTATFDMDVNAQGVTPGQYFFVTLSAFYAKGYSYQIRMQAVN